MNISGIDLNLLPVFDAVYRTQSLTRAGLEVGLSQPAVSHALSRLRIYFGDPLFRRTSHGMKPTPKADAIAGPLHEALRSIQDSLNMGAHEEPPALGFSRTLVAEIPYFLDKLAMKLPKLQFPVMSQTTDHILADLRMENLGIGVVLSDGLLASRTKGLTSRPFMQEPSLLLLAERHPLARKARIHLSDLAHVPFAWLPTKMVPALSRRLDQACRKYNFRYHVKYEVMDHESLFSHLMSGNTVCIVPWCHHNFKAAGICWRPLDGGAPPWKLSLTWKKNNTSPLLKKTLAALEDIGHELTEHYEKISGFRKSAAAA
jgi:DNA-binding transcriptional LysR family regulator